MINASLKNRINISHRRMKTSIQAFNNVTSKKNNPKQQKLNEIFEKGKTFYNNQNFNLAIPQFQDYLQYRQNDDEALYLCAISFLHLNQPLQAIKRLEKISSSYANKEQSYLLIAMSFSKLESYQKSLQVINQCLQKYQRFEEGYSFRGKLYLKFEQFEMAQKDFFYSLKLNPQSFISRAALGDCYFLQHKYQSALQSYTSSLKFISDPKYSSNISDILLKKGICYFSLQLYPQTIKQLQQLTNKQANCESYFYLGVSYLKIGKKQEGILNLEYCIKLQAKDNKSLIEKAFKSLIQLYLGDYQFYQAVNVLKLIEPLDGVVDCCHWKEFVEGCMLIIKAYYQDGLDKLNRIYKIIKHKEDRSSPSNKLVKRSEHQAIKKSHRFTTQEQYQNQFLSSSQKPKPAKDELKKLNSRDRKSFSLKHVRKQSFNQQTRNKTIFKSTQNKAFANNNPYKTNDIRLKHFFTRSIKAKKSHQKPQHKDFKPIFTQEQVIFIMPILLRFKAYAQFFNNNYLRSLDTYEEYENYIKSIFGREIGELGYNRAICQGFLMNKTELYRQSIEKMTDAIEIYQKFYNNVIPVEPLLYKMATYLKLSLEAVFQNSSQVQDCDLLFDQVLDIVTRYKHELDNHHLTHYYLGIMAFFCGQYTQAQTQLQRTLKIVEQCSWKYLWLKGLIQINLSNFYQAIKQFTAGLILQQAPSLYLSRAISFLLQGTRRKQKQSKGSKRKKLSLKSNLKLQTSNASDSKNEEVSSEVFIQNSFQDLQKFIELQTDQQKISLWVTKLLFYNEAYEEAARALQKVDSKCEQLLQLEFWIRFYQGDFQECGKIGNLMMDAFEGKILNQEDENHESLMNLSQNGNIIDETLKFSKVSTSYQKWIIILHLFKRQKYSTLIKYLQKQTFDTESFEQEVQLKYNIGITYFMQGQINKALNFFQSFLSDVSGHQKLQLKIRKILNVEFTEDQCVPDLSDQISINGNHRLSQYLPYKSVQLNHKHLRRIFIKPSIPFPQFPKPNIIIKASQQFFQTQLDLERVDKRIQAPWIKRNKEKVQFTEQIVEAYTDFLKETKQMSIPNDQEDLIHQDDEINQTIED